MKMLGLDRPPRAAPTVWQSHAHATAVKADPSYPTFVQDRAALATKPVYEVHFPLSENPQRLLEAPVTEVDFYKIDDVKVNPVAKPVAEAQEMIRHVLDHIESLQLPGFIGFCWGADIEDETRAITLGGWGSIEVRLLMLSEPLPPSLSPFTPSSCKRLNAFISSDRTTCVWARWMNIRHFWNWPKKHSNASQSCLSHTYISNRTARCPPPELFGRNFFSLSRNVSGSVAQSTV
jgi:hypothetical protein